MLPDSLRDLEVVEIYGRAAANQAEYLSDAEFGVTDSKDLAARIAKRREIKGLS